MLSIMGVGMAQSRERERETGWKIRDSIPCRSKVFLYYSVQTGSRTHPASYLIGTSEFFSRM
jgi:hypothetical protein